MVVRVEYMGLARKRFFVQESGLRSLILSSLLVAAFCLRLYGIDQPPMDFSKDRQYHGALLARGLYEWLLSGNLRTVPPDGIIEPPILETLASVSYMISGGEHLWIPRLLSALFWMVGGVFLYLIARKISSPNGAVFSVAFYLFVPYGVFASRAFMPDPLMVMLLVTSIFTILRYHEQPSTRRLLVAAAASSLAIFVKPGICLFQVFGAFVALAFYRQGVWRSLLSPHSLIFAAASILPTGLYYLYGTVFAGFLAGQASGRIIPEFVLHLSFWESWLQMIQLVMGLAVFVGAFVGTLLLRGGMPRALMIGLWGGYFIFGLTFTYDIHNQHYYSMQLIPVVALALGPVGTLVMNHINRAVTPNHLGQVGLRRYGMLIVVLALFLSVVILGVVENRSTISQIAKQDRAASRYARYVATFEEVGDVVNHSRHTLILFGPGQQAGHSHYEYALMYHGRLSGAEWWDPATRGVQPRDKGRVDSAQELFGEYSKWFSPEYFVVSTGWWNAEETRDLRRFLIRNFPVAAQDDDYVVFDLTRRT
jgi:hypothetical protein